MLKVGAALAEDSDKFVVRGDATKVLMEQNQINIATAEAIGKACVDEAVKQGVRVTGTDGWSWDAPFSFTAKRFLESGDPGIIWEGHKAGRDIGYCHMEKLTNLDALPPSGFKVCCFPVKIAAASAGRARRTAITRCAPAPLRRIRRCRGGAGSAPDTGRCPVGALADPTPAPAARRRTQNERRGTRPPAPRSPRSTRSR